MRKLISVFLVLCLFSCPVFCFAYDDQEFKVDYLHETSEVKISGYAYGDTTIYVSPYGEDVFDFIDIYRLKTYGSFHYKFHMPISAETGKYAVYMENKNQIESSDFIYYDIAAADKIVSDIDAEADRSNYVRYIKDNAENLGLDVTTELYINNVDNALSISYSLSQEYSDSADFGEKFNKYLIIAELSGKDADTVLRILMDNDESLGIDFETDFNQKYSDKAKAKLCANLSGMDYAKECTYLRESDEDAGFSDVFEALGVLAKVQSAQGYEELKQIYTDEFSDIISENSKYSNNISKEVFKNLIKKSFSSLSDIKNNFDDSVKDVINSDSNESNKNNRPGGGSGLSFPSDKGTNTSYDNINDVAQADNFEKTFKIPALTQNGNSAFPDVPDGHWAYTAVSVLGDNGIVAGYEDGSFGPDISITRAEYAKMIVSAFSFTGNYNKCFDDVLDEAWYAKYVNIAADNGLIKGYMSKFNPDDKIKREDAFVIAYRCASAVGKDYSGTYNFDDINEASIYAWPAIFSLAENQIIRGDEHNNVNPLSEITRAEAAQLLYNLLVNLNNSIK